MRRHTNLLRGAGMLFLTVAVLGAASCAGWLSSTPEGGGNNPALNAGGAGNSNPDGNTGGSTGGGTGGGAGVSSPFDASGATTAFGIPAGLKGTITAGQQMYSANCASCHPGGRDNMTFQIFQSAMSLGPMAGINLTQQQLADLTAYSNRSQATLGGGATGGGTTGGGTTGGGTTGGGTTGGGTTGGGASGGNFDAGGNTSAFGIPVGMTGNTTAGQAVWSSSCALCHSSERTNLSYSSLTSALAGIGAMHGLGLSDQQKADLVAYLNRNNTGAGGSTVGSGGTGDDDDASAEDADDDSNSGSGDDEADDDSGTSGGDDSGAAGGDDGSSGGDDEGSEGGED